MTIAANIPQQAWRKTATKSQGRSRVTNGSQLLPLSDGRSITARRFRDLYEEIATDLGGLDHLSQGQKQLIRRAAMLSAECERLEAMAARGEAAFDLDVYGPICDRLGRLFGRLGLERKLKDATPNLDDLIAKHQVKTDVTRRRNANGQYQTKAGATSTLVEAEDDGATDSAGEDDP